MVHVPYILHGFSLSIILSFVSGFPSSPEPRRGNKTADTNVTFHSFPWAFELKGVWFLGVINFLLRGDNFFIALFSGIHTKSDIMAVWLSCL